MGRFLVRHVDRESGAELARFALPNLLAYEGIEYVYRQLFPAYQAAMMFQMSIARQLQVSSTGNEESESSSPMRKIRAASQVRFG